MFVLFRALKLPPIIENHLFKIRTTPLGGVKSVIPFVSFHSESLISSAVATPNNTISNALMAPRANPCPGVSTLSVPAIAHGNNTAHNQEIIIKKRILYLSISHSLRFRALNVSSRLHSYAASNLDIILS